jgi:uncharacterized membrane protein
MARLRNRLKLRSLRTLPKALAEDESGVIGPMVAVLGVSLLGAAGLALDVGLYYQGNRDLRAATEAAALAAAMNPYDAKARAEDYLVRNGYDASVLKSVEIGRYCADIGQAAGQRFDPTMARCPGNGRANAVRLVSSHESRRFLTGVLGDASPIPDLSATASAARIDEAGVSVTSDVLTKVVSPLLDPVTQPLVDVVNGLLGGLLGIPISLGRTDVRGLMQGNVDAGLFFDALAEKEGFTGTYGELVRRSHGLKDVAEAAAEAAATPEAAAALRVFARQVGNGYAVPFEGLFGLGVWKNMPVGEADHKPALRAGMNAYSLITYAVQSGPTAIDLSKAVGLLVPVNTVKIGLVSSGAGDRPRFAFGPAGEARAGSSALRIGVMIDLPVNLAVASVGVHLPVIVDVGAAQAEVSEIDCSGSSEQARDTTVAVHVRSGTVNAYIGDTAFDPMAKSLPIIAASDIRQASILSVHLLGNELLGSLVSAEVKGRAVVQPVTGSGPNDAILTFGPGAGTPAAPALPRTIGNTLQLGQTVSGLTTSLLGSDGLDVQVKIGGTCLLACNLLEATGLKTVTKDVLPPVLSRVTALLGNVVDPLLNNVLAALGVQVGSATVATTGARCGVPVLI